MAFGARVPEEARDYAVREGRDRASVQHLGRTPLGWAYARVPPKARELWPDCIEQIRANLGAPTGPAKPVVGGVPPSNG